MNKIFTILVTLIILTSTLFTNESRAQWEQTNGPGRNVTCFAVSGTNIFAGTSIGAFLSTNNGTSWTAVNNGLTNLSIRSLAVSGTNIFAGTDDCVFRSTNNGNTWTAVNNGLTNLYVLSLAVSQQTSLQVHLATECIYQQITEQAGLRLIMD
ncbi:MAG: hypothetical protein NTY74_11340 [Ignavibacteriae bacterium]|nr:hypothetical protein [Ignavibacteriota bacterium]